ncbi:hypothetical protein [Streptomyces sp. ISL-100]|uniref:hypothetical protein n=1 Tax=Streptomyces sp. ISL-100 TaxID=2819173 RepID=UPI001BEB0B5B|nr:hypothetical protein [Streptomyces sp. ISL-100]MBT2400817.1 hypothetical protein [Streptomyces sp. ISL-100]
MSGCTSPTSRKWRAARDVGALEKLADKRKSLARPKKSQAEIESEKLWQENERLKREPAKNKMKGVIKLFAGRAMILV